MRYIKAYFQAFLELYICASFLWLALKFLFFVFNFPLSPAIALYFVYVAALAAFGGVVREWMGSK